MCKEEKRPELSPGEINIKNYRINKCMLVVTIISTVFTVLATILVTFGFLNFISEVTTPRILKDHEFAKLKEPILSRLGDVLTQPQRNTIVALIDNKSYAMAAEYLINIANGSEKYTELGDSHYLAAILYAMSKEYDASSEHFKSAFDSYREVHFDKQNRLLNCVTGLIKIRDATGQRADLAIEATNKLLDVNSARKEEILSQLGTWQYKDND